MEAREKGRTVRRAIDEASGRLPVGTTADWRDISHVIEPHIPAGTSYDLAEAILWYAGFGFTWSRQTAAKPMDENLKRCPTIAVVRQPILWPIGEREVSVTLVPNLLANFDTVERACAFIRDERWT